MGPIAAALLLTVAPQQVPADLVEVDLSAVRPELRAALVAELALDVAGSAGADRIEVLAGTVERARLAAAGLPHRTLVEDLAAFYAERLASSPASAAQLELAALGTGLSPPFAQGSMGGYYTLAQVLAVLEQIHVAHPAITALADVGTSVEGRPLRALRITDSPTLDEGEPAVRFDALHHAREPISMQAVLWLALSLVEGYGSDPLATYLVNERDVWILPVVNPDGYVFNEATNPNGGGLWRKNRRVNGGGSIGVDLNRNYAFQWGYDNVGSSPSPVSDLYRGPSPASEPETQAVQAFLALRGFRSALSVHTFGNEWIKPYGYDTVFPPNEAAYQEVSALATEVNGYAVGTSWQLNAPVNGSARDYDQAVHGTLSWTPEIGGSSDGFWPAGARIVPLCEENLLAFQRTALAGGAWARLTSASFTPAGTSHAAGSSVGLDVVVRNSGVLATATGVQVLLSSGSPHVQVLTPGTDVGVIGPYAQTAASPTLVISPTAPVGAQLPLEVRIEYEGFEQLVLTTTLTVGDPPPLIEDGLELDVGWTVGALGDTATGGVWQRAEPAQKTWLGSPLQPGSDASPEGTLCFVTDAGGGLPGVGDVDGQTTLLSPPFDLSLGGTAFVQYSRWVASLGGQPDFLTVSISADGGQSWTLLEKAGSTQGAWAKAKFSVSDFVQPGPDMRLRFVVADQPDDSFTEAAVDDLRILLQHPLPRLTVYGSAQLGTPVSLSSTGKPGSGWLLAFAAGAANVPLPGIGGEPLLLDPLTSHTLLFGAIPSTSLSQTPLFLPADLTLAGATIHLQSAVFDLAGTFLTNADQLTFVP